MLCASTGPSVANQGLNGCDLWKKQMFFSNHMILHSRVFKKKKADVEQLQETFYDKEPKKIYI